MKEKILIINADDFGMSHEFNTAITNLLVKGYISSTSLMAVGPAYDEARDLIQKYQIRDVGIHLVLTCDSFNILPEAPILYHPLSSTMSLCDAHGNFFSTIEELCNSAIFDDLVCEIACQIEKVTKDSNPSHIDFHMHSLIPRLGLQGYRAFFEAYRLKRKKVKRYVRIPSSYYICAPFNYVWGGRKIKPYVFLKMLHSNLSGPDYCFSFPYFGLMDCSLEDKERLLAAFFNNVREGITELYVHPCIDSITLRNNNPYWRNRYEEYLLLQRFGRERLFSQFGITLATYRELLGW